MGEKKGFLVKKDSKLPYAAAALGGVMLLFCFLWVFNSFVSGEWIVRFRNPLLYGFPAYLFSFMGYSSLAYLLVPLSAILLIGAGCGLAKKSPVFAVAPVAVFLLENVCMVIKYGRWDFIWRGHFGPFCVILLLVVPLAVTVLSLLTVLGVIKTKRVMAAACFAGAAVGLILELRNFSADGRLYLSEIIQVVCLYAGVGVLALSLEYTDLPARIGTYTPAAGAVPAGAGPQAEISFQTEGLSPCLKERRGIAACILLSFVTGGIYLIYWKYTLCKKIRAWAGESEDCAGETACLALVPFYDIYWMYTRGKKLFASSCARGVPAQDNAVVYLLLGIFGLGLVSYALIQNECNKIADLCSRAAPGPSSTPAPEPEPEPAPAPLPAQEPQPATVEGRIAQLRERLEKGEISQEEYDAEFQKLLRLQ